MKYRLITLASDSIFLFCFLFPLPVRSNDDGDDFSLLFFGVSEQQQ